MSSLSKRVLVTGAAGFIGNACAREFLSRGWGVAALVHRREPEGLEGAALVRGTLSDQEALGSLLAAKGPFDAVVNCAGIASDVARRSRVMEANYLAAMNLAQALERRPVGRLVHISTTDVYGLRDFTDADESTPLDGRTRQPYPRSKVLAEKAIAAALPAGRYVLLRPGVVCGPGDKSILPRVLAFLRHSPWVVHFGRWRGQNRWPLAHVRNVATAAVLAATCDGAAGQAYNVVDPAFTTVEAYCRRVLQSFLPDKARMKSISIPVWAMWPYSLASSGLSRALGRDNPLFEPSLYALRSISSNLDFSSRKLQALFAAHGERMVDSFA
ncbi:MAG: NAD-dependent epimerase/dehydratase family protein [Phycisphaerae bacterium]